MVASQGLEVEIAMGKLPVPISVSSPCFALRYEVPKFLARGGHLCTAMLTIAVAAVLQRAGWLYSVPVCILVGDRVQLYRVF